MVNDIKIGRRKCIGLIGAASSISAASLLPSPIYAEQKRPSGIPHFRTKVDFKDPLWNRDTFVRMDADIDPTKEKCGWLKGKAYGVRPNEPVRPLFIVEGFSFVRTKRLEDGSYRRMLREIVFYKDLKTGKILEKWRNPYTDEVVDVVPIANDPYNFTISEWAPPPPSYGGLNKDNPPKEPFLLDWEEGPNGTLIARVDVDMQYPNALDPTKWVRESSGPVNRVSEHFIYTIWREDVENPNLTNIPRLGAWNRITPWLPWMLMGSAPGHIDYFTTSQTIKNGEKGLPADIVAAARAKDEKWLHAPTEDYGPSYSSIENYAREQKPAPVPAGWSPPMPPSKPTALVRAPK